MTSEEKDGMATIFVSHSSQDNQVADDLSRRLKAKGYGSLFLDFDPDCGIRAGRDWERELYRNIKLAGAVIVLCSEASMASRWCFVEIAQAKALGKPIFPVKISPCEVEKILEDRQVIDLLGSGIEEGYRRIFDGLSVAGFDPSDSFHWDTKRPPFPGLSCFDGEDAGIYFGREDEVGQTIESLTRLQRQGGPRLLVVVGSSGSGKSSMVRAGVLPRLKKDRSRWVVVDPFRLDARREADPIAELARSLTVIFPEGPNRPDWKMIRERLRAESRLAMRDDADAARATSELTEYADDLTMQVGHSGASVLLVVDQAEEMFQGTSGDDASAFLSVLRRATTQPGGRVFGLLTLRSDFLGSFQNHPILRDVPLDHGNFFPLGLLPVERFPRVIEGPAERAEIALDPGLVGSMIADAKTNDALPLLAFTLREMYERCRDRNELKLEVYQKDLGGIQGAVARVVQGIKAEVSWTPEVGQILRRAFLKLVRVNDEGQFARRSCRWADLPDVVVPVLEAFVKKRLLRSDGDHLEVTHESLFRVWTELAAWLDEGRELILWKKNLQYEITVWIAHERSPDYLLRGARVLEGRRWLGSDADHFDPLETEFVAASLAAEEERGRLESAARAERRRLARNRAVTAIAAAVFAMVAVVVGVLAVKARSERHRADQISTLLTLKNGAALCDDGDSSRGLLVMAHALTLCPDSATALQRLIRSSLAASTATLHRLEAQYAAPSATPAAAISPDGRTLLLAGRESYLVDLETGALRGLDRAADNAFAEFSGAAFSPDGLLYATSRMSGLIRVAETATGKTVGPLIHHGGTVKSVMFSPDGKTLLVAAQSGPAVRCYNMANHENNPIGPDFPCDPGEKPYAAVYSRDGRRVATASMARTARVWDAATGQPLGPPLAHPGVVFTVAFSHDGRTMATGCRDGGVRFWDVESSRAIGPSPRHGKAVRSIAFTRDDRLVLSSSEDGTAVLWDAATGRPIGNRLTHSTELRCAFFTPDETRIVTTGFEAIARVWRLGREETLARILPMSGAVAAVAFSPDGTRAMGSCEESESRPGESQVWDATTGALRGPALRQEGQVMGLAVSHDGKLALTAGNDRHARLWDVAKSAPALTPWTYPNVAAAVAFSPDDRLAAIGGRGAVVELRDVKTGKLVHQWQAYKGEGVWVWNLAFSPDGKSLLTGGSYAAQLWSVPDGKKIGKPMAHESEARLAIFSPDGRFVLTGSHDDTARIWSTGGGEPLSPALPHYGDVKCAAFRPDGAVVATGSADGTVRLWEVPGGRPLLAPLFHESWIRPDAGMVRTVAFSPDGANLVTGCDDGTARLWNAADGTLITVLQHRGAVNSVAFSPDGKTVLTGSGDRTARLWTLPQALDDDSTRLLLRAQVLTGMERQSDGTMQVLPLDVWQDRNSRLKTLDRSAAAPNPERPGIHRVVAN